MLRTYHTEQELCERWGVSTGVFANLLARGIVVHYGTPADGPAVYDAGDLTSKGLATAEALQPAHDEPYSGDEE